LEGILSRFEISGDQAEQVLLGVMDGLFGLLLLSTRKIGLFENRQYHRKAQQGIQATNQTHGDRRLRKQLLHAARFHQPENRALLAGKPGRKDA
jgi:hypothetical protein